MSMQRRVLQALKTICETMSWQKSVNYERVRLFSSDFPDHELPAIQIYDVGDQATNQQSRDFIRWRIVVEIVQKKLEGDFVTQDDLFNRRLELRKAIGFDPTLGLQGVAVPTSEGRMIHIRYAGGLTDLHVLEHHYLCRLEFEVLFEEPFTATAP